ncbi:hypothetical protein KCU65_g7655, partial [Aureobasidium melanogenum]
MHTIFAGHFTKDGKDFLEIKDISDQELKKSGVYLSMILDESGNLVGLYVGSRTGLEGVYQRTEEYDKVKKTGKVHKKDARVRVLVTCLAPHLDVIPRAPAALR